MVRGDYEGKELMQELSLVGHSRRERKASCEQRVVPVIRNSPWAKGGNSTGGFSETVYKRSLRMGPPRAEAFKCNSGSSLAARYSRVSGSPCPWMEWVLLFPEKDST